MDTLKKVVGKGSKGTEPGQATNTGGPAEPGQQGQDLGDKGAEYLNKKYMGDKVSAEQRENMTDTAREGFENAMGKKVPGKLSE